MIIHGDFVGGNIKVEKSEGDVFYLNNELRDTEGDWFYWAFCVENAEGRTLTFKFPEVRLGYYGPAVSHDCENWEWYGRLNPDRSFTYTFGENENKVYFAHNMLYHPDRFYRFAKEHGIEIQELCKSRKGRSVPYISFGSGDRLLMLTSRHHACESTGSYVLEGVLEEMMKNPVDNMRVVCVPFVDYDGVVDGDQGKNRNPHDHNRDYVIGSPSIYHETAAIRKISENGVEYAFDFHSPWHFVGENDKLFMVRKLKEKTPEYELFGRLFEDSSNEKSLKYRVADDHPADYLWEKSDVSDFAGYMYKVAEAKFAGSLETAYFGIPDNIFTQDKAVETGHCFARALKLFDKEYNRR